VRPHRLIERHSPATRPQGSRLRRGLAAWVDPALAPAGGGLATAQAGPPSPARCAALRLTLAGAAGLLARRRAAEVAEQDIDDYVQLGWLEWQGGTLRLTTTGDNLCRQAPLQPMAAAPAQPDTAGPPALAEPARARRRSRGT
jgi:hypothetical protein